MPIKDNNKTESESNFWEKIISKKKGHREYLIANLYIYM